jgi:hypothetical protein
MTVDEWLAGSDKTPAKLSLAPEGMPTRMYLLINCVVDSPHLLRCEMDYVVLQ